VGDKIQLIAPQTSETIFGSMPRIKDFTVVGVFEVGMFEYDSSTIFMPLDMAQKYFRLENAVNAIRMWVENRDDVQQYREEIMQAAHHRYFMLDWQEANGDFVKSLDVERSAMFLILALIMCVAGFMILSGMWMLVVSKRREIAILRTMGATRGSIQRIFLMCGLFIGTSGTLAGLLVGVSFATHIQEIRQWLESTFDMTLFPAAVYFLTNIPAKVQAEDVTRIVSLAMGIALVSAILPARKAASIPPAEGLRNE
jgi:lipoprotein-releasing system permease protein